jgi:hypothetical protein
VAQIFLHRFKLFKYFLGRLRYFHAV